MESQCKILIVDDEYIMRQSIKHLLNWEQEGFSIVGEAGNGQEALDLVEVVKPHIVITDIVMPKMNGIDLTKYLHIKYPDIQIIILSGYNDFEIVKNAFSFGAADYILKPTLNKTDILTTLKNIIKKIPNFVLKTKEDYNIGTSVSNWLLNSDYKLDIENLNKIFPLSSFVMLATGITYTINDSASQEFFSHEFEHDLRAYNVKIIEVHNESLVLFINFSNAQTQQLFYDINKTILRLSQLNPNVFFVLSNTFLHLKSAPNIYQSQIQPALNRRFYHKGKNLLNAAVVELESQYEEFDISVFSKELSRKNYIQALEILKDYIEKSIFICKMDENKLRALAESTTYSFILSLSNLNLNTINLTHLKLNYLSRLEKTIYADDFFNIFNAICNDFTAIIQNYQSKTNEDIIKRIIKYIDEHYSEPLSLSLLAEEFSFSYYYLSTYFSNHSSEGFNEYLNRVRINKALELLREGNMPISEISGAVGYSDHSYFSKVFKKFTKLTPSQYKRGKELP